MEALIAKQISFATTRLLIVDDHVLHCAGVRMLFHGTWFVDKIAMAHKPREAVELAEHFKPHVTLMDVTLPSPGPFELGKQIMSLWDDSRVIFIDDSFRRIHLHKALEVGGSGYLTKHATFEETCDAVRRVSAGQTMFLTTPSEKTGGPHFNKPEQHSAVDRLTPRELEVIQHLGEGMTAKECAEKMGISYSTIDNHKAKIMKKLDVRNVVQLVLLAIREGLVHQ